AFAAAPCGLDIEVSTRPVNPAVVRRFAPDERDHIAAGGPPGLVNARLLEIWTKKEAYLKWLGAGIGGERGGLAAFSVLRPAALAAGFIALTAGPRGDLTGHVCVAQEAARSAVVREIWEERPDPLSAGRPGG
ncbi:MAG: 4'-phosphopantetheinyl transferase superfamily protein, partial [Bifidobacteriaceae bacterium]|nr:4'-phosphopantetheinyl transferase superfamily protein [Bifidobacteriaceae bacterium]